MATRPAPSGDPSRWLTDRDLEFIVRTTSTRRTDYDRIREIIRDKPDFLEILLEDDRLYQRMASDDEILLKVSPQLLFTVLLRRARRMLKQVSFTMEPGPGGTLPVFDAGPAVRLVEQPQVLGYLADMLASFVRTELRTFVVRRGATYQRWVLSDMDIDDLLAAVELVDPSQRFAVYKRAADVSLFLVGLFPEYVNAPVQARWRGGPSPAFLRQRRRREFEEYVRLGTELYHRAALEEMAHRTGLNEVLSTIGDHFVLAAKPLHVLARQIIPLRRLGWLGPSGGGAAAQQ